MTFALGLDLGGSSVKAVAVTLEGKLFGEANVSFDVQEKFDWARHIQQIICEMESRQSGRAQAIGIAAPGLVAADGRSIARMPGRLQGLEGLNWSEFLKAGRPVPFNVPVLNDAHSALLGEAWLGAARSFQHVIMLTLGTGVGGAALVDGKLLRGAIGRGGHFGHACLDPNGVPDICGMPGSLETVIGNYNIVERTRGRFPTTHALVEAHLAGDLEATACWLKSVHALACAIGSFINILDPEAIIIGGGIARAGPALFEPLEKFVREVEWKVTPDPVKIIPAQLGELAGAYGAAWSAWRQRDAAESS
ncbi:MAG TPA: ROK family protein [Verrucomicrobiae bacterium]|jgi:glucokinase